MFGRKKSNLLALYATEVREEVLDAISWQRRARRRRLLKILTYVVWSLTALTALLIINVFIFLPSLKTIYTQATSGRQALSQAAYFLEQRDWQRTGEAGRRAESNFSTALAAARKISWSPMGFVPYVHSRLQDATALLEAGQLLGESLTEVEAAMSELEKSLPSGSWDLSNLNSADKLALLKTVAANQTRLNQLQANLRQAQNKLTNLKHRELLAEYNLDLSGAEEQLRQAQLTVDRLALTAKILPPLLGLGRPATYLFILQNNDELRPTGGFIGTYGVAVVADGEVKRLETQDVYHLDMPAAGKLKVEPPAPLKKYLGVNYWYLRDANWSPDWPTSASKIKWFYQQENQLQPRPDELKDPVFIVSLTPQVIIDLLTLSGPLTVAGQVYHKNNFVDLLQDTTGKDFSALGYSRWDRKNIIGDLARLLSIKLLANLNVNWSELSAILEKNLAQKNILVYTEEPTVQQVLQDNDLRGEVKQTNGDFLMVVDANLAALKTDAVIKRSWEYNLQETADGLIAKLQIHYANRGNFTWKTTRYRTYTRVYVPAGSKLIKAAGHLGAPTDIEVGEELGKTYFGAFTEIEPGKIGDLSFEYKLPYNLSALVKQGQYSLLIQKQPGNRGGELKVDLNFQNNIKTYAPAVLYSYVTLQRVRWTSDLANDKLFTVDF